MSVSTTLLVLVSFLSGILQEGRSVDVSVDVYFGTGNNHVGVPAGVYRASLAQDAGDLERPALLFELNGAGWVTTHPKFKIIYATGTLKGKPSVVALDLRSADKARLSSVQPIGDGGSCFLTTDQTGSLLMSAQYRREAHCQSDAAEA